MNIFDWVKRPTEPTGQINRSTEEHKGADEQDLDFKYFLLQSIYLLPLGKLLSTFNTNYPKTPKVKLSESATTSATTPRQQARPAGLLLHLFLVQQGNLLIKKHTKLCMETFPYFVMPPPKYLAQTKKNKSKWKTIFKYVWIAVGIRMSAHSLSQSLVIHPRAL